MNRRRRHRQRVRVQALLDLTEGRVSLNAVLKRATLPEGEELLKVTLRQLLLSLPGVGAATVRDVLGHLERVEGKPLPSSGLNVRWLLDGRSRGQRMVSFVEAVSAVTSRIAFDAPGGVRDGVPVPRVSPAWKGFPYTPPPSRLTAPLASHIDRPDAPSEGAVR